jgi:hypothetical protein
LCHFSGVTRSIPSPRTRLKAESRHAMQQMQIQKKADAQKRNRPEKEDISNGREEETKRGRGRECKSEMI